jgi:hypothetical protein
MKPPRFQIGDRVYYRTASYEDPNDKETIPCTVVSVYPAKISEVWRGVGGRAVPSNSYQLRICHEYEPAESIGRELRSPDRSAHSVLECLMRIRKKKMFNGE